MLPQTGFFYALSISALGVLMTLACGDSKPQSPPPIAGLGGGPAAGSTNTAGGAGAGGTGGSGGGVAAAGASGGSAAGGTGLGGAGALTASSGASGMAPSGGAAGGGGAAVAGAAPTGSGPIGFAAADDWGQKGTTGGLGGPEVTPTTAEELVRYLKQEGPLIIKIMGKIDLGRNLEFAEVSSHKSILGVGADATITGTGLGIGLHLWDLRDTLKEKPDNAVGNVIIRNVHFESTVRDPIEIQLFSHHIWIDHCKFSNPNGGGDGRGVDIKRAGNYVTLSYNVFEANLGEAGIVGTNATTTEQEQGRQKVTLHHNWWKGVEMATVQVFHGDVHYFNNYWSDTGKYAIGVAKLANVFSENGVMEGVGKYVAVFVPEEGPLDVGTLGGLKDVGTLGGQSLAPEKVTLNPSALYAYNAMPAEAVKAHVMANAGVGKISP